MKWVLTILYLILPMSFANAEGLNAGFVEGLWFSEEQIFADEPVRIYAAIRNHTGADLSGTIEFFIDGNRIERNNVTALDNRIVESWADWKPTYGEHTLSASLSRIELSTVGSSTRDVKVVSAEAKRTIFVDYDTDGDDIGNEADTDDDGDGYDDQTEIENGSDPLDPDDPITESSGTNTESHDGQSDNTEERSAGNRSTEADTDNSGPQGLEQYLTDSRADRALASLTDTINTTHDRLDAYRAARSENNTVNATNTVNTSSSTTTASATNEAIATDDTTTNESGFGSIERSVGTARGSWIDALIGIINAIFNNTYTLVLFLLSLYLAHPIIVQLTLLLLILFILFKVAQRLGRRPQ